MVLGIMEARPYLGLGLMMGFFERGCMGCLFSAGGELGRMGKGLA